MTRIEGKVAELLNERELVINRGSKDGVEVGMQFKILNARGSQIKDPDSGKVLGSVELTKVRVKIVQVQESLAVGRTFSTIEIPASGTLASFATIQQSLYGQLGTTGSRRVETLRSDEPFAQKDLPPEQSYVKRGDPAVQIERSDLTPS